MGKAVNLVFTFSTVCGNEETFWSYLTKHHYSFDPFTPKSIKTTEMLFSFIEAGNRQLME